MKNYLKLMSEVLLVGETRADRTGTGTLALFDSHLTFDLREGFPAVTTKQLAFGAVMGELLWFLSGSTNINTLAMYTYGEEHIGKNTIWTPNYNDQARQLGYTNGNLGPVYGKQWRNFGGVDQISELIKGLIENPTGRRHLVSAWNVGELDQMALPPCHYGFQCYVSNDGFIDLKWTQRSVDCFLGLPFNIASYAALLHILGRLTGYTPRHLVFSGGDTHIYKDHVEQVGIQLTRAPRKLPTFYMSPFETLDELLDLEAKDFCLINYIHHPKLTGKMSS